MKKKLVGLFALLLWAVTAFAEDITVDWGTRTMNCPAQVDRTTNIRVLVRNVNDLLYSYHVDYRLTPRQIDDFEVLAKGLSSSKGEAGPSSSCEMKLADADELQTYLAKEWEKFGSKINPDYDATAKLYESVPLHETLQALDDFRKANESRISRLRAYIAELQAPSCKLEKEQQKEALANLIAWMAGYDTFQKKALGPHQIDQVRTLPPDNDVTLTVTETRFGGGTKDGSKQFVCSPASGVLTVSGGFAATGIPSRGYSNRQAPTGLGSMDTEEILAVSHSRFSPVGMTLLNYNLPFTRSGSWGGLSLSAGPVFRLGAQEDASSFGFFTGLSVHVWRRMFLTPGLHLGQFADFPSRFAPDSPIPSGFGDPVSNKRWTTRFAIGVTFKAADFQKTAQVVRTLTLTPPPAAPPAAKASKEEKKEDKSAAPSETQPGPTIPTSESSEAVKGAEKEKAEASKVREEALPSPSHPVQFNNPELSGTGCPPLSFSTAMSPDERTVTIIFDNYRAYSDQVQQRSRPALECQILLPVRLAAGYRVAVRSADYRGGVGLPSGTSYTLTLSASMSDRGGPKPGGSSRISAIGPEQEDFIVGRAVRPVVWSSCGGPVAVTFRSEIALSPGNSADSSFVEINTFDFSAANKLQLEVQPCNPY